MTPIPVGDGAVVLEFGGDLSDKSVLRTQAVAAKIAAAALPGVLDVVPAYNAITVFYDAGRVGDYDRWSAQLASCAKATSKKTSVKSSTREIPVCYGGEYGPDLDELAQALGRSVEEVIALHTNGAYVVHAVGFVPGFAYLGGLPRALHRPRRATPRAAVPPGSVGIGGGQTGIYPLETPGGWNLIGRTPLRLFDATREEPALLRMGDRVTFRAILPKEFAQWA